MKTNFFQIVRCLQTVGTWTIHIDQNAIEGQMIVSVLLSDTTSAKEGINLTPMIFNETAKTLDDIFFEQLANPVGVANEVLLNAQEVFKSIEQAKKTVATKSASGSVSPKVDNTAELKKKYEEAMTKIEELKALCKYSEAIELLPDVEVYPSKKVDLLKLRKELEANNRQLSLLD